MPGGIDADLLSKTMEQWKAFWMVPAIMAFVIAVLFFATFWDKSQVAEDKSAES